MQQTPRETFIRRDGSVDTPRAMARGRDARTEALRTGLDRLAAWFRRAPRPAAQLATRR